MEEKQLYELIETWTQENIKQALTIIETDEKLKKAVEKRYGSLYKKVFGGDSIETLVDLEHKFIYKLTNKKKIAFIKAWPKDLPFIVNFVHLNGNVSVDQWRYSTYSNQIETLPKELGQLKGIKQLFLARQQLSELPEFIGDMTELEVLDCQDNKLIELPESIKNLRKLRVLNLDYNYSLKALPDMSNLENLEEIYLEYTHMTELDESLYELKKLKMIKTQNSFLDRNTSIIKRLIEHFGDECVDTDARESIALEEGADADEYKGKEAIVMDDFHMNHLPKTLFNADCVKKLAIKCSHLQEIPDDIQRLQTLEELHLEYRIKGSSFPEAITRLTNLKKLSISSDYKDEYKYLPESFGQLTNLEYLDLKEYKGESLIPHLKNFKKLKYLATEGINLMSMPADMARLKELKTLKIKRSGRKEDVLHVDPALSTLESLEEVYIQSSGGTISEAIFNLPKSIKRLELEVNIWSSDIPILSALPLGKLIKHFEKLEILRLKNIDIINDDVKLDFDHPLKSIVIDGKCETMPSALSNLKQLEYLTFFGSKMSQWNNSVYECEHLKELRISQTKLATIPTGIGRLKNLERFGFENTKLKSLPEDIVELPKLKKLCLGDGALYKNSAFKKRMKNKFKELEICSEWY